MYLSFILVCYVVLTCLMHKSTQLSKLQIPVDVAVSLESLSNDAANHYHADDWPESINLFEKALVNFKMLQHMNVACGAKCQKNNISKEIGIQFDQVPDLYHFGNLIVQANCIKLCKEEHPYGVANLDSPSEDILEDFEEKVPYNFLQFAYYKMNRIKKACQAAHTYLQANPKNEQALSNINFYKSLPGINETHFKDLEAQKFYDLFLAGVKAYGNGNHEEAVSKIEICLLEYFNAFDECQHICYKPYQPIHFYSLYVAIGDQFLAVFDCARKCEEHLNPVVFGEKIERFAARCFAYLQYSYYTLGNWGMAVPAAASVFLLHPEDESSKSNMKFYEEHQKFLGSSTTMHFSPRSDSYDFHVHLSMLEKLIAVGQLAFDNQDTGEVKENENENNDILISSLTEKIVERIEERLRGEP